MDSSPYNKNDRARGWHRPTCVCAAGSADYWLSVTAAGMKHKIKRRLVVRIRTKNVSHIPGISTL